MNQSFKLTLVLRARPGAGGAYLANIWTAGQHDDDA